MTSNNGKILVADDQSDIVDTISFRLEDEGYEVFTALDGAEALDVTRREQPDIDVLDVMMPKENGYQVATSGRMRRRGSCPSGHRFSFFPEKEREDFLQTWSGADAFVYKPFDMEDLVRRIGEMRVS